MFSSFFSFFIVFLMFSSIPSSLHSILNQHLQSLMPGLTAKVFRTYNASETLQTQLPEEEALRGLSVAEKVGHVCSVKQHDVCFVFETNLIILIDGRKIRRVGCWTFEFFIVDLKLDLRGASLSSLASALKVHKPPQEHTFVVFVRTFLTSLAGDLEEMNTNNMNRARENSHSNSKVLTKCLEDRAGRSFF